MWKNMELTYWFIKSDCVAVDKLPWKIGNLPSQFNTICIVLNTVK